jgi:hypothetical protein
MHKFGATEQFERTRAPEGSGAIGASRALERQEHGGAP